MPSDIAGLRRDRAKASDRMNEIVTAARGRSMTDDESRDFTAAADGVKALDAKITAAEAEAAATTATDTTTTVSRADAAQIVTLCVEGGVPKMASSLIAEGADLDEARKRIGAAGEITNLVALARRKDPTIPEDFAATMIAQGKSVEQVRTALFDRLVSAEEATAIVSQTPLPAGNGAGVEATRENMKRQLKASGLTAKEA